MLSRKLYDDTERSFRLTTAKKQGKKFLYYYNGVGGDYLPVEQLDNFVLKTLKIADFDDLLCLQTGIDRCHLRRGVMSAKEFQALSSALTTF